MLGIHDANPDIARQMFVDFDEELLFWRDRYRTCGFFRPGLEFGDYEPAFKLGINVFLRSHGRSFDELKDHLLESYERIRGATPLEWSEASAAAGAAWERMHEKLECRGYPPQRSPGNGRVATRGGAAIRPKTGSMAGRSPQGTHR